MNIAGTRGWPLATEISITRSSHEAEKEPISFCCNEQWNLLMSKERGGDLRGGGGGGGLLLESSCQVRDL